MSMAMQRAKYTGDPGLFGDIWGGIKGAANIGLGLASNIPIFGGAAKIAQNLLFRPAPGTQTYAQAPISLAGMPQYPTAGPGGVQLMPLTQSQSTFCRTAKRPLSPADARLCGDPTNGAKELFGFDTRGMFLGSQRGPDPNGAMNGAAMQAGKPCPVQGYHWNKSGYFLLSGEYVFPGTKMVKNRRRNPANPRATSNAITRIKGAKRYAKSLSSISIRKKC